MAHLEKCMLHKHEGLILVTSPHIKLVVVAHTYNPCAGQAESEDSKGLVG